MYQQVIRPLLFQMDPEQAHHLITAAGQKCCSLPLVDRLLAQRYTGTWPGLEQFLAGIRFPNPVGLAAGFDKNATLTNLLRFTGFGYAEYGSITARPSDGNARPRLFRITKDRALINRMGLNNDGAKTICRHISDQKNRTPFLFRDFPCGINIAKTHDPEITGDEAIADYLASYRLAVEVADYITLNVSCPNTREGKTFEDKPALSELLNSIDQERQPDDPPLFVKFSPDADIRLLEELVTVCEAYRMIHGYVISNTSSRREGLKTSGAELAEIGSGGLSGAPLFRKNLALVSHLRHLLPADKIIIGCGGVDSPDKAVQMLKGGADLLQLYTGFIYEGSSLIPAINNRLVEEMITDGIRSLKNWLRFYHNNLR